MDNKDEVKEALKEEELENVSGGMSVPLRDYYCTVCGHSFPAPFTPIECRYCHRVGTTKLRKG